MANPSPAAVAAIRQRVTDWTQSVESIAAALNAPDAAHPNPTPQGQVPRPFGAVDLVNAAAAGTRPNLGPVLAGSAATLIVMQDAYHLSAGLDALAAIGTITAADATAMKAVLSATIPDPSWQANLSWAQAIIGRPVDTYDVIAAKAAGG